MRVLRASAVALVFGLLALLLWAMLAASRGANLVSQIAKGKDPAAPAFTLTVIWPHDETWPADARRALANGRLSLRALRGHPVVLNFFASWCVACKDEARLLHAEAQQRAGKVLFLGIDVQDLSGDARAFARKYRINYVAVRDRSNTIYNAYGLTGVPESYFIDARGRIVVHIPGEATRSTINRGVAAITSGQKGGTLPGGAHVKAP
jgi:cytochrome c biogenesis protein CcmG/thiol:disulfide interchange protein DsbE